MDNIESTKRSEAARVKVLETILEFVRTQHSAAILEIRLASTEKEARSAGWPSMETQMLLLQETMAALPVDVASRVRVISG